MGAPDLAHTIFFFLNGKCFSVSRGARLLMYCTGGGKGDLQACSQSTALYQGTWLGFKQAFSMLSNRRNRTHNVGGCDLWRNVLQGTPSATCVVDNRDSTQ